ncbi:NYN domain-containing protein [Nocardioides sp. J2M5]|uniref:NYN domain-containing protein n=1 Tax=Nocardioides palaemonis TaxID=2829810 RepID=UPI001BA68212|nr:NYN domain-containing protein [Nocardioides palaemonis]MBS2936553.1 NYN domain-containing protein [Nocardioides palaemonis]
MDAVTQVTNAVAAMTRPDQGPDTDGSLGDGDLATLVRRWMAAGTRVQERVRRESSLRVAPTPVETEEPADEPAVAVDDVLDVAQGDERDGDPAGEQGGGDVAPAQPVAATHPRLPQRPTGDEADQPRRVAVLIDARRVSADVASGLLGRLAQRGSVNVCRAYADWSRAELGDWAGRMRREGLHSFHHFTDEDDQALVAMAIDAVDIARDASVDEVVLAGDLTSALPLVHRLHAAGVRVVVVGAGHTPHDVRAACDEFIDHASVDGTWVAPVGRHRA